MCAGPMVRTRWSALAATYAALSVAGCLDEPVAPGPAPTLLVLSGAGLTDTIGAQLGDPLVVQALDASGAPIAGLPLDLAAETIDGRATLLVRESSGAAPVPALDLVTGADGSASVFVALGERAGPARLLVTHPPTGATETATFAVLPGGAVSIQLSPPDTVITNGTPLRPRRYVYDRAGNEVARPLTYTVTGTLAVVDGMAVGSGVGSGTATASIDGQTAQVNVTVVPPGRVVIGGWARTGLRAAQLDGTSVVSRDVPGAVLLIDDAPSGTDVAFAFRRVVRGTIGGPYQRVTSPSIDAFVRFERWPRYSGDGAWIYFEADLGSHSEIWRARPDGGFTEPVTSYGITTPVGPDTFDGDRYPAVSHAGDRISFSSDAGRGADTPTLRVRHLATGTPVTIGVPALSSRWSPDDAWIAFVTPDQELMRVRPDGTEVSALTATPFAEGFDWSPDGQYIVGLTPDGAPQLLVVATGQIVSLAYLGAGLTESIAWYDDPD